MHTALRVLLEKGSDAGLLREMIGIAAQRLSSCDQASRVLGSAGRALRSPPFCLPRTRQQSHLPEMDARGAGVSHAVGRVVLEPDPRGSAWSVAPPGAGTARTAPATAFGEKEI